MNRHISIPHLFPALIVLFIMLGCENQPDKTDNPSYMEEFIVTEDSEYTATRKLKDELIESGVDTVMVYIRSTSWKGKYYNVFWQKDGKGFIHKFYSDLTKAHSVRMRSDNEEIFEFINSSRSDLQESSVWDDIMVSPIHYSYSSIDIFIKNDSVCSDQMMDVAFDPYIVFKASARDVRHENPNYEKNIKSGWYTLLTLIESKISSHEHTGKLEREAARVPEILTVEPM